MSSKSSLRDTLVNTVASGHANSTVPVAPHDALHKRVRARVHHHVHRLRQKPDHHKKAIAFAVAFSCTAVLFTVWYFYSLPRIVGMYHTNLEENKRLNRSPNIIEGFNNMYGPKANTADVTDGIQAE